MRHRCKAGFPQAPAVLAGILLLLSGPAVAPAFAHDWYPPDCCSDRDCMPIDATTELDLSERGWVIRATGEVIAHDDRRLRRTPQEVSGDFHRCSRDGRREARTICLFIPEMGS